MSEHRLLDFKALERVKDGTGHSIFGASGSPMYLACPGSLIPNILAPDESGADAAYGTVAHSVTEQWLNEGSPPEHLLGSTTVVRSGRVEHSVEIDEAMFEYAESCVDRCEWLPGLHLVEEHVDFSYLTPIPNQGGTLDHAALQSKRATVSDHKFGSSPENIVYAKENPQLALYTVALWRDPRYEHFDFRDFIIRINQPRLNHFDEWHTTTKWLRDFEEYARERMALAWTPDAPRVPGVKQCRFCKVSGDCPAAAKLNADLTEGVFTDTTSTAEDMDEFAARLSAKSPKFEIYPVPVRKLTTAQISRMLPFKGFATRWWEALELEATNRAQDGERVEGFKLVASTTHRRWVDSVKARQALLGMGLKREAIVTESFVSPHAAEEALVRAKIVKRRDLPNVLQHLVEKPSGAPTLVPANDRRQEMEDIAASVFGAVQPEDPEEL